MAMDHWGYWKQFPPPPAMPSTPKVPDVTMTMSKQVHSYARNEGAQNCQAREAEESVRKGMEVTPLHKERPESIPFLLVPLARIHGWYSPQPFNLFKRRHLLITAFVNIF